MHRNVRYIFGLILVAFSLTIIGCDDKPETNMRGMICNPDQYQWIGWIAPLNDLDHPVVNFNLSPKYQLKGTITLQGSTWYRVKRWLPGGYNVSEFDILPNSLQDDADLDGTKYDWILRLPDSFTS